MTARIRWSIALTVIGVLIVAMLGPGLLAAHAARETGATPIASPAASPVASPAASPTASPVASPVATPFASGVASVWVELGPNGVQIARAVSTTATCPNITIDGSAQAMDVRAAADTAFPVTICQTTIPTGAKTAAIGNQSLKLLTGAPHKIAVIGDTGCRIKGTFVQDCDNPTTWPFSNIARELAAWQPDLIIHVGDYHYRESVCPTANAKDCAGSPTGDTWASWNADFFAPAASLLPAAPWVFVRGNHEDCSRAGAGWFRLLDPRAIPGTCQDYSDPYAVPVGDQTLIVFDSAVADDSNATAQQVDTYKQQLATVAQLAGDNAWFLSHRPIWGPVEIYGTNTLATGNATLQAASGNQLPAGIKLQLSGHVHLGEAIGFDPSANRAPTFITGNSGTELDQPIKRSLIGVDIGGAPLAVAKAYSEFGYMTLVQSSGTWTGTLHDATGQVLTTCAVQPYALSCSP